MDERDGCSSSDAGRRGGGEREVRGEGGEGGRDSPPAALLFFCSFSEEERRQTSTGMFQHKKSHDFAKNTGKNYRTCNRPSDTWKTVQKKRWRRRCGGGGGGGEGWDDGEQFGRQDTTPVTSAGKR